MPGPQAYRADEVVDIVREGLLWHLRPAEYFQWHQAYGFFDEVLTLFKQLAPSATQFVDVGANIGFYSLSLANRFPQLHVLAVEPNPQTRAALEGQLAANALHQVAVEAHALSEHEGSAVLKGGDTGDSGKFSLRDSQGASQTDVVVKTMTLDTMLQKAEATAFDLLKIDVEGFEPAVLLGGAKWIKKHVPTVCLEYLPRWYHEDLDRAERAFSMMQKTGYRAYKLTGEEAGRLVLEPFETMLTLHQPEARDEMTNIVLVHPRRREHIEALTAFVST